MMVPDQDAVIRGVNAALRRPAGDSMESIIGAGLEQV